MNIFINEKLPLKLNISAEKILSVSKITFKNMRYERITNR
jgi:hypothetical protein